MSAADACLVNVYRRQGRPHPALAFDLTVRLQARRFFG
jgi:hypothetical protein